MRLRNIPGAKDEIAANGYVINEPQINKGRWKDVFGNDHPIFIEVGMGKGQFIMELALRNPEINYIGIEMYDSVLIRGIQKREEYEKDHEKIENLLYIREDARLLPEIFGEEEVSGIYLNFSDPWPKARHEKRRLTSRKFLSRYTKIIPKDGLIEFKTDNQGLFAFSLEEAKEAGWKILQSTFDLHHNKEMVKDNIMTEYEEKFSAKGNPICKMIITQG